MIINDIKISQQIDRIDEIENHMLKLVEYLEEIRKDLQNQCKHSRLIHHPLKEDFEVCKYCGEKDFK